jgi:hypothetical protein
VLTINDRPVFRFGLQKAQAKLVSQYMVKEFFQSGTEPRMVQVWDYLVELPGADGQPKRLTIRVRGFGFDLPEPGNMVPPRTRRSSKRSAHGSTESRPHQRRLGQALRREGCEATATSVA